MAELKFEAPLAQFEEAEEWQNADYRLKNLNEKPEQLSVAPTVNKEQDEDDHCPFEDNEYMSAFSDPISKDNIIDCNVADALHRGEMLGDVSGSLEDLVNTFDEKITRCFCIYQVSVENLGPVQVRSQEEIMIECQ